MTKNLKAVYDTIVEMDRCIQAAKDSVSAVFNNLAALDLKADEIKEILGEELYAQVVDTVTPFTACYNNSKNALFDLASSIEVAKERCLRLMATERKSDE